MTGSVAVVYDIRREEPPVGGEVRGGVLGALCGALLLAVVWKRPEKAPKLFALFVTLGWAGFSAYTAFEVAAAHRNAQAAVARGEAVVTEGVVADFSPGPKDGRGFLTFRIGERVFKVPPEAMRRVGLNQTSVPDLKVKNGARLRVATLGEAVVSLETLDGS